MRLPDEGLAPFDPVAASPLTFERVRTDDFPALALGIAAGRAGGAAPAVFNAANEEAVALFLDGRIGFMAIAPAIASALDSLSTMAAHDRTSLLAADAAARAHVRGRAGLAQGAASAEVSTGARVGCMINFIAEHLPWLAPVLVFGLVVFVHELGHFLAAKATGVYAPRFSIGFGPALWAHRWGETEYRIAALPLGGYVRMASRDDEAVAMLEGGPEEVAGRPAEGDPNAMMPFGPKPIPADRWFESKSLPARLVIMLAGVTMNTLLTLSILTGVALYYGRSSPSNAPVIDRVLPESPAAAAGLVAGDSVEMVGSVAVHSWQDLVTQISAAPGTPLTVTLSRHGTEHTLTVTPRSTADTNRETKQIRAVGKIGAAQRLDRHPVPITQAVGRAWTQTWGLVGDIPARTAGSRDRPCIAAQSLRAAWDRQGLDRGGTQWCGGSHAADRAPEHQCRRVQPAADPDTRRRSGRSHGSRVDQGAAVQPSDARDHSARRPRRHRSALRARHVQRSVPGLQRALLSAACAVVLVSAGSTPVAAQTAYARFDLTSIADTTFTFAIPRATWVVPGLHGLAVDPSHGDGLHRQVPRDRRRSRHGDCRNHRSDGATHDRARRTPRATPGPLLCAPMVLGRRGGGWLIGSTPSTRTDRRWARGASSDWWLVAGGWWLVAGDWWLVAGGW